MIGSLVWSAGQDCVNTPSEFPLPTLSTRMNTTLGFLLRRWRRWEVRPVNTCILHDVPSSPADRHRQLEKITRMMRE